MGLFDSIKKFAQSVTDSVAEVTADTSEKEDTDFKDVKHLDEQAAADARPFDVKFREVVAAYQGCQVDQNIPPDFLEAQAGRQIYQRGGNRCLPDPFTYVITYNGKSVYVRFWKRYEDYDHVANRAIRMHCDLNGIKVLDFFDRLPNGVNYIRMRIDEALAA